MHAMLGRPSLVPLGTGVYSWTTVTQQDNGTSNTTIIILGWLEAAPKHLLKYIQHYDQLYPKARIILLTSTLGDFFYRTQSTQRKRTTPAVKAILANSGGSSSERTLVHAFSNGGAHVLCNLSAAYHQETGRPLPLQGLILDSAPGRERFLQAAQVMWLIAPKQWYLRIPLRVVGLLLLCVRWVLTRLGLLQRDIEAMRRGLNEGVLGSASRRRLYIYSDADKQVAVQDIRDHVADAKARGFDVRVLEFRDSAHVSHMVQHGAEYWGAVDDFWRGGTTPAST